MEQSPAPLIPEYSGKPQFSFTQKTMNDWRSIAFWSKFFAIYAFIVVGLNVLYLLAGLGQILFLSAAQDTNFLAMMPASFWAAIVGVLLFQIVGWVVMFFGGRYHLNFTRQIKRAIDHSDQAQLELAWMNMKRVWRLSGFYALFMLLSMAIGLIAMNNFILSRAYGFY